MKVYIFSGLVCGALLAVPPGSLAGQAPSGKPAGTQAAGSEVAARMLGTVRLTRNVMANGELLRAGRYQVRLTEQVAKPAAPGATPTFERWVEFVQGGEVKGREVVSIVPQDEIAQVSETGRVPPGGSRVEMLKGNEFVRVWINSSGTHYLIHMPPA
jgi:hypothetical protein